MGQNKALLPFRGKPLIQHQIDLLSPLFEELLLGANDPAPYSPFKIRVAPDLLTERCSLTGIHALLKAASAPRVFAVGCDMPFLNPKLIDLLLSTPGNPDAIIPQSDRGEEPLHAVYSRSCLPAIEDSARRGIWKATAFTSGLRVERPRIPDADWLVDGRSPFLNANTPEEWRSSAP